MMEYFLNAAQWKFLTVIPYLEIYSVKKLPIAGDFLFKKYQYM